MKYFYDYINVLIYRLIDVGFNFKYEKQDINKLNDEIKAVQQ